MGLSQYEIERRKQLLEKMRVGMLTPIESTELHGLLEREKQEASDQGKFLVVLGLLILLGMLGDKK